MALTLDLTNGASPPNVLGRNAIVTCALAVRRQREGREAGLAAVGVAMVEEFLRD
jgi:hypothetical protein